MSPGNLGWWCLENEKKRAFPKHSYLHPAFNRCLYKPWAARTGTRCSVHYSLTSPVEIPVCVNTGNRFMFLHWIKEVWNTMVDFLQCLSNLMGIHTHLRGNFTALRQEQCRMWFNNIWYFLTIKTFCPTSTNSYFRDMWAQCPHQFQYQKWAAHKPSKNVNFYENMNY